MILREELQAVLDRGLNYKVRLYAAGVAFELLGHVIQVDGNWLQLLPFTVGSYPTWVNLDNVVSISIEGNLYVTESDSEAA